MTLVNSAITGLALLVGLASSTAAQSSSRCLERDQSGSFVQGNVELLLSVTGDRYESLRQSLGISSVSPQNVTFVTDSVVCRQATDAAHAIRVSQFGKESQPRPAYVIRAGAHYYVVDPTIRTGEWLDCMVLDEDFGFVSVVLI